MKGLIVGYGVVGKNLHREYKALTLDIYDKFKTEYNTKKSDTVYDIAFICVDTPFISKDNPCDISQVEEAICENDARIYVIKSTVLPGTTQALCEKYNKTIIFSPEYYGGTQHCNRFNFDFTILGWDKKACIEVQQALQHCFDGRHTFHITDSKTAELTKYMENSYLATKVSFCCAFNEIAESYGVNYEELRELFILDPRINPSHTFVYRSSPYWNSHCLNKDVRAIAYQNNNKFLNGVIEYNEKCKENFKQNEKNIQKS